MTRTGRNHAIPGLAPPLYSKWRATEIGIITDRLERELVLELAGEISGRRTLDLGCGDGEFALELVRRGAAVTGVDASAEMIAAARARPGATQISFEIAAAERLPFASQSFDLVVAITILCFLADAAPVFDEIARVLRPGGRLVIGELGRWSSWAIARRLRAWFGSPVWRRARFRTRRELVGLAEAAGLSIEMVRGAIYYPRWTRAAQLCAPLDPFFGRLGTVGAAFIALSARKAER